ncbi:hypothetical protein [Oenococcus oeni]|uniref:hypothetical protein n=1 Tax=Oenococcus oeni TaxID=1247 RepID=UPI0002979AE7|nr:hypothetical protein [Oenococcus oeni]EKP90804.1 hypothetical protein AWRIB129_96 [Oenococcus oeni DSM 20252 = AWRIB129]KGH96566.1 hypothetical protein X283_08880 [Oenococcus oeni IOEB_1491]KGI06286.1 hypothetical protein X462_01865 [Oenococcus oeni S19]OIK89000.1 hypothetical protein ATW78_01710 [Oenococcus oeni]OIL37091.1 hypothetical protein ATX08_02050 [Oenococcus oeni]
MVDKNKKIIINPQQFALNVIGGNQKLPDEENKKYIKRQLILYLEALFLVQDFNDLEKNQFALSKATQRDEILEKVIEHRYH